MPSLIKTPYIRQKPINGVANASYGWLWNQLMLAWMNFDGNTSVIRDYSTADTTRHNGTGTAITISYDPIFGPVWNFDGSTSQINVAATGSIGGALGGGCRIQSWDTWIKTTSSFSGKKCSIYMNMLSTGLRGSVLGINTSNQVFVAIADSAVIRATVTGPVINDGRWHHCFVVMNHTTASVWLFIDGNLIGTATGASAGNPTGATMSLGVPLDTTDYAPYAGQVAHFRLWGLSGGALTGSNYMTDQGTGAFKSNDIAKYLYAEPYSMFMDSSPTLRDWAFISSQTYFANLAATSGAEVSSLTRIPAKVQAVTSVSSSSLSRLPARSLSAVSVSVANKLAAITRTMPAITSLSVPVLLKTPQRTLSIVQGPSTATVSRTPTKVLKGTGTGSVTTIRSAAHALSVAAISVARKVLTPARTLTVTEGASVASVIRNPQRIFKATEGASIVSILHQPEKVLSASGGDSASLVRSPLKTFATTGISSSSFIRIPLKVFKVTAVSVATKAITASRTLNTSGTSVATISRLSEHVLSVTGASVAFLIRKPQRILIATGVSSTTVFKAPLKTLISSGISSASLSRSPIKIFTSTATGAPIVSRLPGRVFLATAISAVTKVLQPSRTLSTSSAGSASLSNQGQHTLSTSGGSTATVTNMPERILFAVGSSVAVVSRLAGKILSAVGLSDTELTRNPSTTLSTSATGEAFPTTVQSVTSATFTVVANAAVTYSSDIVKFFATSAVGIVSYIAQGITPTPPDVGPEPDGGYGGGGLRMFSGGPLPELVKRLKIMKDDEEILSTVMTILRRRN